jgi:hypothetical protein
MAEHPIDEGILSCQGVNILQVCGNLTLDPGIHPGPATLSRHNGELSANYVHI